MAKRTPPRARFVKSGQSCPVGWSKRTIRTKSGRKQELCVAPKR